jgi:hypothetical protein
MISTQKILLIGLFMNILIGMLMEGGLTNPTKQDIAAKQYEAIGADITNANVPPPTDSASTLQRTVVGNEKAVGMDIWEIIGKSMNPWSVMNDEDYTIGSALWLVAWGIVYFRIALYLIMGYELWQIFFAKKQS